MFWTHSECLCVNNNDVNRLQRYYSTISRCLSLGEIHEIVTPRHTAFPGCRDTEIHLTQMHKKEYSW